MTSTMSTLDKSHHRWHTPKIISTINDTTHTTPYLCSDNSILDPMLLSSDIEISQNQGMLENALVSQSDIKIKLGYPTPRIKMNSLQHTPLPLIYVTTLP